MKKADIVAALDLISDDEELALVRLDEAPYKAEVVATLEKAAPHEPLFLVRAQDVSAAFLVRYWERMVQSFGVSAEKRAAASQRASEFEAWPGQKKVPD